MKYAEFLNSIQIQAKETAGKGGCVSINHIIKNNGCELDGLVIMEEDSHVSPTIYLNDYYEQYEKGRNLDDIVNEIILIYLENKDRFHIHTSFFHEYEKVKNTIVYRIVNYKQNEKLLELVPHKKFLDLAVIFYCLLEQEEDGNATALIYHSHVDMWGVTEEDLFDAAVTNTPQLLKSSIKPMSDMLRDMIPSETEGLENHDFMNEQTQMYVLTNQYKIHGASCMLYEDVLRQFAEKMKQDLYILPSSIHEVILLPKLSCYDKLQLNSMVREVNCDGVSKDEILSDHVYEYHRKSGMIEM